jgi:hypothetical protein
LRKEAERIPQELLKSKKRNKNISFDALGTKEGRIHVSQENISKLPLRKYKSLNKNNEEESNKRNREEEDISELINSKKKTKNTKF